MPAKWNCQQGDCISGIAESTGHFWKRLWNASENAELNKLRKDPNVLLPDDVVHVPDLDLKEESGETEKRHRFKRKGVPSILRLVIKENGLPRSNERYLLKIDGVIKEGKLGPNGELEISIPGDAQTGTVRIGDDPEEIPLALGSIDPIETLTGVQGRLRNLGFYHGPVDGQMSPDTKVAIQRFQAKMDLPATGEPNADFIKRLKDVHQS